MNPLARLPLPAVALLALSFFPAAAAAASPAPDEPVLLIYARDRQPSDRLPAAIERAEEVYVRRARPRGLFKKTYDHRAVVTARGEAVSALLDAGFSRPKRFWAELRWARMSNINGHPDTETRALVAELGGPTAADQRVLLEFFEAAHDDFLAATARYYPEVSRRVMSPDRVQFAERNFKVTFELSTFAKARLADPVTRCGGLWRESGRYAVR